MEKHQFFFDSQTEHKGWIQWQTLCKQSILDKRVTVGPVTAQLSVWDTAGQERFHALGPIYYRDADGDLLVYDITDAESFNKVRKWVKFSR